MKENDCWGDFGYLWDVNDIPDGLGAEGERLMEVKNYADELVEEDTLDDEYNFTDEDYEIDEESLRFSRIVNCPGVFDDDGEYVRCPVCGHGLHDDNGTITCPQCGPV